MQNINVYRDPLAPDDPTAFVTDPADANIWRNDQDLMWTLISTEYVWQTIVFDAAWVAAGGTQPVISTESPTSATATGPGPNPDSAPMAFRYTMSIMPVGGGTSGRGIHIGRRKSGGVVIDPDVWNQPQP